MSRKIEEGEHIPAGLHLRVTKALHRKMKSREYVAKDEAEKVANLVLLKAGQGHMRSRVQIRYDLNTGRQELDIEYFIIEDREQWDDSKADEQ